MASDAHDIETYSPALTGQVVVVLGGSAGIGLETARGAKRAGAEVILVGRNRDRLERAAADLGALRTAAFVGVGLMSAMTAALPALTANLAVEIAPVRVNLIAAGFVDTPLSAAILGDQLDARRRELADRLPIGRVVTALDVASLAVHLMTNTALTGATFDIDGGQQLIAGPPSAGRTSSYP